MMILGLIQLQTAQSVQTKFPKTVCETHQKDGDYIIGGIFKPYISKCVGEISSESVSFIESMTYAIETINNRNDLLPGVDLGYEIRNACEDEDITVWTLMTMTTSVGQNEYMDTCPDQNRTNSGKMIGIVGTGRSATSIIAAKVGRVVTVPIVSYFATSDELSDSERFSFFFRTVPADKYQVKVIVDILQYFNWKYIALFYSLDSYGIHGARQIVRIAEMFDICIAINMPIAYPASDGDVEDIAARLVSDDKVNVIVAFSVNRVAKAILQAVKRMGRSRNFTFIGSDGWNPTDLLLRDFSDILRGGIFVHFYSEIPVPFTEYYDSLPFNQDQTSQWYQDKLNQVAMVENCSNWMSCLTPSVHWNTQQVINAVNVIAYALNATLSDDRNVLENQPVDGWLLRKNLLDASIPFGVDDIFRYDEDGEVPGRYVIRNWQYINESYKLVTIGKWDTLHEPPLTLDLDKIQWTTLNKDIPTSLCIDNCLPGYVEVPLEKKCCWGCQKCNDYAIVVNENNASRCQDCAITHWPDAKFTTCLPIKESFLGYRDPVVILTVAGACLGYALIVVAAIGFWYYSDHRLIKASGRELSPINLFGLGFSCMSVLLLNFLYPTYITCVVVDVSISTSFCISFAPVLLKVNRIWRIFNLKPGKKVRFTGPQSQVIIVASIIIAEVRLKQIHSLIICSLRIRKCQNFNNEELIKIYHFVT